MKWKSKKAPPKDAEQIVDNKKQSVSSTQSMPFLRDDNLTFHRFTTNVSSLDSSRRPSNEPPFAEPSAADLLHSSTTVATMTSGPFARHHHQQHSSATSAKAELSNFAPVWTTAANSSSSMATATTSAAAAAAAASQPAAIHDPPMYKNSYTMESHDFQYLASSSRADSVTTTDRRKSSMQNGSTAKLMLTDDDQSNKQSKCSLLRGVILCLCLNFTYANVVRFPRELERHGVAFLVPYATVLLLIGLPTILLEIALGQFLGQGSAHAWRASPILKGASVLGRIACWLGAVWTSLQAVIAVLYIGELTVKTVPFTQCASKVRLEAETGYLIVTKDGQECLLHLLQTPVWEHGLYYALLAIGLAILWLLAMLCTYSSRCLRRCIYTLGLASLALLTVLAAWHMTAYLNAAAAAAASTDLADPPTTVLVDLLAAWPFDATPLASSDIWFAALVQVIGSTGIGVGVWPVLTGKFLYKGDAVRTSMVYMCFNIFVCTLSVCFFVTQFGNAGAARNATVSLPELKPLTAIYDAATNEPDALVARLVPGLAYVLIVLVALLTMATAIYTASRFIHRHPNYIISLLGLATAAASLFGPRYIVARLLDTPIVGVFAICALIFDIMSITWIYGAKNIYTDLEFSIGRPILKSWVFMWCITPVLLTGVLAWWASALTGTVDLHWALVPRWAPIVLALALVACVACVQVYDQVDYNCCSMIQEAAQSSTDWGPADPIVRHAWKQWRSVCEDTGQKDFTLRRRGTRDYTHSIKKGQYSRAKYGSGGAGVVGRNVAGGMSASVGGKSSSVGSNSPNYSGSVFEDSAIEEDVSVEKFGGATSRGGSGVRATERPQQPISYAGYAVDVRKAPPSKGAGGGDVERQLSQKQYFYVPSANSGGGGEQLPQSQQAAPSAMQYNSVSKIEIVPEQQPQHSHAGRPFARNPLGRMATAAAAGGVPTFGGGGGERIAVNGAGASSPYSNRRTGGAYHGQDGGGGDAMAAGSADHICWRKFSVNTQEFSTEL